MHQPPSSASLMVSDRSYTERKMEKRRRSDRPGFIDPHFQVQSRVDALFSIWSGTLELTVNGRKRKVVLFPNDEDKSVAYLAVKLAQRYSVEYPGKLRATLNDICVGALLHDIGKKSDTGEAFMWSLSGMDLREVKDPDDDWKPGALNRLRDDHTGEDGEIMLEAMIDKFPELRRLNQAFLRMVIRYHGNGYRENHKTSKNPRWWALEINIITLADEYVALTSSHRDYRRSDTASEALAHLREGLEKGRFEKNLFAVFEEHIRSRS